MFSKPTNIPIRRLMAGDEIYLKSMIGEEAYNKLQTMRGVPDWLWGTATLKVPNNTLHPNHSETAQERPASPASGAE